VTIAGINHTRIVNSQDVGMLQPGGQPNLALEPLGAERGGQLRVKQLQGHWPIVLEIVGSKHGCHSAPTEHSLDAIAISQPVLNPAQNIGHQFLMAASGGYKPSVE
jgi:hypothetical protein